MEELDKPTRETIHVPLQPAARDLMEGVRERTGVPKTEAATRILEWFFGLDEKLQLAVLNRNADTRRELTRLALQQMAGLDAVAPAAAVADLSVEQAGRLIHTLTDHVVRVAAGRADKTARRRPR